MRPPHDAADALLDELAALERTLFEPGIRRSAAALDRLLADDFEEIAATGAVFGKRRALERLPEELPPTIRAERLRVRLLTADLAQVRYDASLERPGADVRRSRRSSLWRRDPEGWRMVFHQGTPLEGEPDARPSAQLPSGRP